jgi:hypothetical protein
VVAEIHSRRTFLTRSAAALIASRMARAETPTAGVPPLLDHVLLGCDDLDRGIDFVFEATGVRAAFGGVHPGRGTRNALLSLGERRYLEVIAPDPQQPGGSGRFALYSLSKPRLVNWAAHTDDLGGLAARLSAAGTAFSGPTAGSRIRPDGKTLDWKTLKLEDDQHGLLPFFIQWGADTVHPSVDAPGGCRLASFAIRTPQPDPLAKSLRVLGLEVALERSEKAQLTATLVGPRGRLHLTS